jgi:hypothetical protein
MSRTYRTLMKSVDCSCGAKIWSRDANYYVRKDCAPLRDCEHSFYDHYSHHNVRRDHKNTMKPGRTYKTIAKKHRRAKEREAMQNKNYENIPIFHKEDKWNWY